MSKKIINTTTIPRDLRDLDKTTNNLYESVVVISKRANQLSTTDKEELKSALSQFASPSDNLEEIIENPEQIEMSKYYERLPKPSLRATEELIEGKIFHRKPLD